MSKQKFGERVLIMGPHSSGKTSSIIPNEELGIIGLIPEKTFIVQCAGPSKRLPKPGWRKLYNADKKVKEGGNYAATRDVKLIRNMVSYISNNRKEIENIVIDDSSFTLGLEILSHEDKMDYDDWRGLGSKVFIHLIDYLLNHQETAHLNIIMTFHTSTDNFGEVEPKLGGQMIKKNADVPALFDTVLCTKVEFNAAESSNDYKFVTKRIPGYPGKSLHGCFNETLIPNDLGLVLKTLKAYHG